MQYIAKNTEKKLQNIYSLIPINPLTQTQLKWNNP